MKAHGSYIDIRLIDVEELINNMNEDANNMNEDASVDPNAIKLDERSVWWSKLALAG